MATAQYCSFYIYHLDSSIPCWLVGLNIYFQIKILKWLSCCFFINFTWNLNKSQNVNMKEVAFQPSSKMNACMPYIGNFFKVKGPFAVLLQLPHLLPYSCFRVWGWQNCYQWAHVQVMRFKRRSHGTHLTEEKPCTMVIALEQNLSCMYFYICN